MILLRRRHVEAADAADAALRQAASSAANELTHTRIAQMPIRRFTDTLVTLLLLLPRYQLFACFQYITKAVA